MDEIYILEGYRGVSSAIVRVAGPEKETNEVVLALNAYLGEKIEESRKRQGGSGGRLREAAPKEGGWGRRLYLYNKIHPSERGRRREGQYLAKLERRF